MKKEIADIVIADIVIADIVIDDFEHRFNYRRGAMAAIIANIFGSIC